MTRHPRTFLLIAAVLGALAWFVVRGRSAREVERADTPRVEVPADTRAELSAESQPLDPLISRRIQAANAGAKCGLRFRVVDERTLEPVPDLGFLVYLEQGVVVELGRGRTDVQGRAELHDLAPTRVR